MTTDFFPGFAVPGASAEKGIHTVDTLDSAEGVDSAYTLRAAASFPVSNRKTPSSDFKSELAKGRYTVPTLISNEGQRGSETPYPRRWSAFAFRVKQFTCSLSREQRADVARRPRFYSFPWIRRADDPDLDDCLP